MKIRLLTPLESLIQRDNVFKVLGTLPGHKISTDNQIFVDSLDIALFIA